MFEKITEFVKNNTGVTIGLIAAAISLFWIFGFASRVQSIANPSQKVTRPELRIEVETYLALADIRFAQLDKQDELKNMILEHAMLWATTGQVNPLALGIALQGIVGTGAIVDNVTKRRKERKRLEELVTNNSNKTV